MKRAKKKNGKHHQHTRIAKALRAQYERELTEQGVDASGKLKGIRRSVKSLAKGMPQWRTGQLPADADAWVWSDQHLGHANIIRYCNRPFADVAEMDEAFYANWEATVGAEDTVVFVGDLAMGAALHAETFDRIRQMPGARKILIAGNHDVTGRGGYLRVEGFDTVNAMLIAAGEPPLAFTHLPLREVPEGWINIHGHTHAQPPRESPHINVSVEQLDYAPVRLSRLRTLARALVVGKYPRGATTLKRLEALESVAN